MRAQPDLPLEGTALRPCAQAGAGPTKLQSAVPTHSPEHVDKASPPGSPAQPRAQGSWHLGEGWPWLNMEWVSA